MSYTVVYWNRAPQDVYDVIRGEMPAGWTLVTLTGDTKAGWHSQLAAVDFMIVADWAVTEEELRAAPRLRMVQHQGVGHEKIDKEALKARNIPLALCPAGTTVGVAEHTLLLILAVYKRLVVADARLRQGTWLQWGLRSTSFELAGKTLGLYGFGRIGQAVARRAHAFDARILFHDPYLKELPPEASAWEVTSVPLPELLRQSDILSLHLPTTTETRKCMSTSQFQQMKRRAILINTSRGALVDEPALIAALQDGTIAAAGLDVFEREPVKPDNPLLPLENVILTPHIAAGTVDALRQKMRSVFANLQRCAKGEPIRDRVV
ncbi:MAG TPA: 2-hydroxyacid dehydrogenase [Candidatus Methylomirabilis sp.]|nr:2-hydroxyacid dehydrogenase [Candidatus Methylomirabilis sp.]HSC69956.1 2-hydroxyacid dehydrogenase [Candidatus Methylomirabilis sp.]